MMPSAKYSSTTRFARKNEPMLFPFSSSSTTQTPSRVSIKRYSKDDVANAKYSILLKFIIFSPQYRWLFFHADILLIPVAV